ncbi:hypothetical protein G9A89_000119 [Geosiphon pyriformis]|nr:hypothetical protein G9A89_000119 [Geosiphon pyriformis]
MYTDAKIDDSRSTGSIITKQLMNQLGHQINRAASARIITTDGATKTPISKIDALSIEVNGIIVPIKNTQELQLSQNSQYTCVPAMCSHFKPITMPSAPLIEFEKEKKKSTWEVYQVSWADENHNKLPPILFWDNNNKKSRRKNLPEILTKPEKLITTKTNQQTGSEKKQTRERERRRKKKPLSPCVNCGKKLLSMGICCGNDKEYSIATKFYCHSYNQLCFACETILSDKGMWNDIPGCGEICDEIALQQLEGYLHNKHELWRMVYVKAEGTTTSKLLEIKNNPLSLPEPKYIQIFDIFGNIEDNSKEFHEHYQHLALTKEEQEQHLEQLNT